MLASSNKGRLVRPPGILFELLSWHRRPESESFSSNSRTDQAELGHMNADQVHHDQRPGKALAGLASRALVGLDELWPRELIPVERRRTSSPFRGSPKPLSGGMTAHGDRA